MTRADAIKQALRVLTVIDSIQEPSSEDASAMGAFVDQERARLSELSLVWWAAGEIPDAVAGAFCRLCAEAAAETFGKQFVAQGAQARIAAVKSSARREAQRAEYF